jgi:hypothetical protein
VKAYTFALLGLGACIFSNETTDAFPTSAPPGASSPPGASAPGATNDAGPGADTGSSRATASAEVLYPDLSSLHDQAMSRTCALNNGVCHNSKQYPDMHTPTDLMGYVGQRCNAQVDKRADFRDPCEPPGDHLVVAGIDAEIATADQSPSDAPQGGAKQVTLNFATPLAAAPKVDPAASVSIHRGALVFAMDGAHVSAATATSVTLDLSNAAGETRFFLDDRVYPWTDLMLRVADVNRNGKLGASLGVSLVVPGDPAKSYVMMRILDDTLGELMPVVCRAWSEAATRALGCWIKGLKVDTTGAVTNGFDPIDYSKCDFNPTGKGRCTNAAATGFAAVQEIFSQKCGGSGCHVDEASPAAGLDLSLGKAAASLVSVASSSVPSMPRVTPGKPDASYLFCKLDATCAARQGARMPRDEPPLADADLATIRAWIEGGATSQ